MLLHSSSQHCCQSFGVSICAVRQTLNSLTGLLTHVCKMGTPTTMFGSLGIFHLVHFLSVFYRHTCLIFLIHCCSCTEEDILLEIVGALHCFCSMFLSRWGQQTMSGCNHHHRHSLYSSGSCCHGYRARPLLCKPHLIEEHRG